MSTPRSNSSSHAVVGEVVEPADVRGTDGVHERVALAPPLVEERERGFDLAGVEQVALEADGVLGAGGEELVLGLAQVGSACAPAPRRGSLRRRAARRWRDPTPRVPPATTVARPCSPRSIRGRFVARPGRPASSTQLVSRASWRAGASSGSPVARVTRSSHRSDAPGREDVAHEQLARGASVDEPAGARRRAWRRAATRTAPRRGSSGSRRARRRGGSSPPSRARGGRRGGARAGSARRGPTRACRGRRRDRRRGCRSKFVITSTQRANTSSAARRASARRGRERRRPRRRSTPATSREPARIARRGGPKSIAMPSVVSACAAPRTQPGQRRGRTRGRRWRGRTRGASCPSTARSARRCRARARRRRGRCRCRTRAGSCRRARRGRCASSTGRDVEAEAVVGAQRERFEVGVGEEVVDGDRRPRRAGPGRTGRRSATGAGRRRRTRSGAASDASTSALPRRERRGGGAVDLVEGGEQAGLVELAGREREREVVAVRRASRAAWLRSRASSRTRSATSAPICFDASHAARRSAASSLVRRISAMALSSTRSAVDARRGSC